MSRANNLLQLQVAAREFTMTKAQECAVISAFLDSLHGEVSQTVNRLFKDGKHNEMLQVDIDPTTYTADEAYKFRDDYQAISFLSKYEGLTTGIDTSAAALTKFHAVERECKETNRRFKSYSELENSEHAVRLFAFRRKIDLILGEFSIEEMYEKAAWGPGVTTFIKGEDTSQTRKFQSEIGISQSAYDLFGSSLGAAYPTWFREEHVSDSSLQFVKGNKVALVNKNAKTKRVIMIGPGIDLWLQRGAGKVIASRLKRWGVDLSDQTRNQRLALRGSIDGTIATVDHVSASDSIAWAVVHKNLPVTWFTVLDSLRSKSGTIDGVEHNWEKFSSMGNGYTFELESLIFYCAALVVCEELGLSTQDVSIFGDDVIIPTEAFDAYVEFTEFLGFKINKEKSFSKGHFRESCGAHWFNGLDVKPIFHKKALSNAQSLYRMANSIRRYSHRCNSNYGCDSRFLDAWRLVLRGLPFSLRRVKVPLGVGDVGIASNFDEAVPSLAGDGFECYSVVVLQERSVTQSQECHGLLCERLIGIQGTGQLTTGRKLQEGSFASSIIGRSLATKVAANKLRDVSYGNETALRDRTKVVFKPILVHDWYDLGPWI